MPEGLVEEGGKTLEVFLPKELVEIGVGPDLQRFFDAMIYKLRRNAHKGNWDDLSLEQASADLTGEVEELQMALASGSTSEILMEAADVANEALIVANIALAGRGL